MMKSIVCPDCKGKGHILDPAILLIAVWGWGSALFGRNNRDSVSRQTCPSCNGKGYKRVPTNLESK